MLKKFILWFLSPFHDTQEIQNKGYTEGIKKGQCNKWFAFDYCDSIRFTTFLYLIESLESISDPPSHNFIYVWRKSKGYYVLQILQFIYTFKGYMDLGNMRLIYSLYLWWPAIIDVYRQGIHLGRSCDPKQSRFTWCFMWYMKT